MSQVNILPLFSSPIAITKVAESFDPLFNDLKKLAFTTEFTVRKNETLRTKSVRVLDDYPEQRKIILDYFDLVNKSILKLGKVKFNVTTSWITKTEKNCDAPQHYHANSYWSGLFYFDTYDSPIEFSNVGLTDKGPYPGLPDEYNFFNAKHWEVMPEKNMLLFFPSHVYHKILPNKSNKTRYSLAFNIHPTGKHGFGDSVIDIDYARTDETRITG